MDSRSLRLTTPPLPPESLLRAEEHVPAPPRGAIRRPTVEKVLDGALRTRRAGLVILRGPRGTGRRTAVALWSRRLVRDGTVVVWVDVAESSALDGPTLATAVRARLASVTGQVRSDGGGRLAYAAGEAGPELDTDEPAAASPAGKASTTPESLAAALDVHEVVLVVDRLGTASEAALAYLARVAGLLRRSHVVALTAMALAEPEPTFGGWSHAALLGAAPSDAGPDMVPRGPGPGTTPSATGLGPAPHAVPHDTVPHDTVAHVELTLRDLAVRPAEAQTAAAALGASLSGAQARLLVRATAGWAAVVHPVLAELHRLGAAGEPVTDDLVATVAAAHRAAFLRGALPEAAISVLVEACLAPQFSRGELTATGLLSAVPDAHVFVDRLASTGVLRDDPASPDDVLAVEPGVRRALLDYARGRDPDELHLRAAKAARRRERAHDPRGALLVALEAGDPDLVRDLLRALWTDVLDGRDPTLPEALWSAASAAAQRMPAELRALLSVIRSTPGRPGRREPPADRPAAPDEPLVLFIRTARLRRAGRPAEALGLARAWLRVADGAPVVARILVGLQAAVSAAEAGLLHEASRYAETAHHSALGAGTLPLAAAAAETAALVHALDSDVRTADDWSVEAAALPEPPGWWRHAVGDAPALAAALFHLDRFRDDLPGHLLGTAQEAARSDLWFVGLHVDTVVAALRGQEELAVDQLRDVLAQRGLVPSGADPTAADLRVPPLLALDLGRLYLALGRGTSALVVADALTTDTPASALLDAQLHLAQGQHHEALRAVAGVGSVRESFTPGARIQAHLIASEARAAVGDAAGARRELTHAIALARRGGGYLPFWWASPEVLRSVADGAPGELGERVAQVLLRRRAPADVEFVVVPDRQLLVLNGLADGLTSTQVAKAAFVSHNTVKTQIREVYRRLGVHDRAAALQRARELGLLDPMVRARLRAGSPSRPSPRRA